MSCLEISLNDISEGIKTNFIRCSSGKVNFGHSPPKSFQREEKEKYRKNEALPSNLSKAGQVGSQVFFSDNNH